MQCLDTDIDWRWRWHGRLQTPLPACLYKESRKSHSRRFERARVILSIFLYFVATKVSWNPELAAIIAFLNLTKYSFARLRHCPSSPLLSCSISQRLF